MAYSLLSFDSVTLPLCVPEDPLDTGAVTPGLVEAAGGVFNRYGSRQVLPRARILSFRGRYDGSSTALDTQLDALRAKIGVYGLLKRKNERTTTEQSIYARLLTVNGVWAMEDAESALLTMQWESAEPSWRHASGSTATGSVGGNTSIVNDGTAPIEDAVITVTATSSLVNPTFTIAAIGVSLKFTGTVGNTKLLVINAGTCTVTNDGASAYDKFSLQAGHTARGWLPLTVTTHTLAVAADSGTGDVSVAFTKRYF